MAPVSPGGTTSPAGPDPSLTLRSPAYLRLLLVAALLGVPLSAAAYGFLVAVPRLQSALFTDLPQALGFQHAPVWWPVPVLAVGGLLTAAAVIVLPGGGGHEPVDGFHLSGAVPAAELPGVLLASVASLGFGAVLGPEAPLITLGSGLAALAMHLSRRRLQQQAMLMVSAAGAFAAVSVLLGSPLLGAFLLLEAAAVAGPMLGVLLLPGLLASGVGALVFTGLGSWAGLKAQTLSIPDLPAVGTPNAAQFGWAVLLGLAAAVAAAGVRRLSTWLQPYLARRRLLLTPVAGLCVGGLAVAYTQGSGHPSSDVLYSGQESLPHLMAHPAAYSVGALALLLACKALAYCVSLAALRGGPIFPSMLLGAAGGGLLSHLPGLPFVTGAAVGIGALAVGMLRLPLTGVLLATLLLGHTGLTVMPLVIVAVVVAHVTTAHLEAAPANPSPATPGA